MKLFIDTADIAEIKQGLEMGLIDGVTTNPSLVAKTGRPFESCVREICETVPGPVSLEVFSTESKEMISEGRKLRKYGSNVVVKIPIIAEGLKAIRALSSEGIPVNVTLCFNPLQALLAAKAGAAYISPFVGRLDDISSDGMELIEQIVTIYENYFLETEVLVASVRHPMHLVQAALIGAHVSTVPFSVIRQMLSHPLTEIGLKRFLEDAAKIPPSTAPKAKTAGGAKKPRK